MTKEFNKDSRSVYGYVNGAAVYSRDEFIFGVRKFGPITNDEDLIKFAKKVSWNWHYAGHCQEFKDFYLSEYAMAEPYNSLTLTEFARLKELQKIERKKYEEAEAARDWKLEHTYFYADNSIQEVYVDKDGNRKTEMVEGPHGDVC